MPQSASTSAKKKKKKWRHHPSLHSSRQFPFHDAVSKHSFVRSGAVTQKAKAKPRKMGGKSFPAVPLTNSSSELRLCTSHAWGVAATSKLSFTMNTEGDVFYVYVKRQFVSTVISADECLWFFFLEVRCFLGARCVIKAICKAKWVTLMCNRCPRDPRNIKLMGHTDGGGHMYKHRIFTIVFSFTSCIELVLAMQVVTTWMAASCCVCLCLVLGTEADADKRNHRPWQRGRSEDREEKTDTLRCHSGKWSWGLRLGVYVLFVFPVLSVSVEGRFVRGAWFLLLQHHAPLWNSGTFYCSLALF